MKNLEARLRGKVLDAIYTYSEHEDNKPERKVAELRNIARYAGDLANRIEQTRGVNESQSRTDIGADSDTLPAICECKYRLSQGRGHRTCRDCGLPTQSP